MIRVRLMFALLLMIALAACNKSQPSGVPDAATLPPAAAPAPQQPALPPPPPVAEAVVEESAPPPLDSPIPPYEKTGYPACDEYIENYRQCLNTRLGGDERKPKALELHNSVRAILGNISRGTDPARVAALCKKSRGLATAKLSELGCTL